MTYDTIYDIIWWQYCYWYCNCGECDNNNKTCHNVVYNTWWYKKNCNVLSVLFRIVTSCIVNNIARDFDLQMLESGWLGPPAAVPLWGLTCRRSSASRRCPAVAAALRLPPRPPTGNLNLNPELWCGPGPAQVHGSNCLSYVTWSKRCIMIGCIHPDLEHEYWYAWETIYHALASRGELSLRDTASPWIECQWLAAGGQWQY